MVVVCTVGAAVASAVAGAQESAVPGRAQSQGHGGPALSADTGLSLPSSLLYSAISIFLKTIVLVH